MTHSTTYQDRMAVYDGAQAQIDHLQGLTAALRLALSTETESPQPAHMVNALLLAMDHGTEWARAYIEGNLHPHVLEAEYDTIRKADLAAPQTVE